MTEPFDVPPGTVLRLPDGQWGYGRGALVLRVHRVRWELALHYGGEQVWVAGERFTEDGVPLGYTEALVPVAALRDLG